jgi:hypothetical protein
MIHVTRWILFSFACGVVGINLGEPAIAGTTSARVPISTEANHGMWPESVFAGGPHIEESRPESLGRQGAYPIGNPSISAARIAPYFWFGHPQFNPLTASGCLNSIYGIASDDWSPRYSNIDSSMQRTSSANPFDLASPSDAIGCFHQSYPGGATSLGSPLAPGENKDALYGPMYHPDPNILQ